MHVATNRTSVGIRELKNNLSRYVAQVAEGEEIIVTDHGKPVARLAPLEPAESRLDEMIRLGLVRPARSPRRPLPPRVKAKGTVSDLVAEQRR